MPDGSEAALADAFREMEGKVSDARAAALVLEALMEKTIAERPQHRSQVVQLTEDEATGLFFAAQHLGDLVRALHRISVPVCRSGGPTAKGGLKRGASGSPAGIRNLHT